MLSRFQEWNETEKKLFVARLIHQINYSNANLELFESALAIMEKYPIRPAYFFKPQKTLNYVKHN